MGTSHGKPSPRTLSPRDLPTASHMQPYQSASRLPYSRWPLWAAWSRGNTPRSSCRHSARAHWRLSRVPRRCLSGVLRTLLHVLGDSDMSSIVRMPGLVRRMLLSAAPSTHSCSSDHQIQQMPRRAQEQEGAAGQLQAPRPSQDHCPGKTVHTAPGDSGQGEPEKVENPEDRELQRGSSKVTTGAQSAFRPLVAHGPLPSFVPRSGALQRKLCTQSSRDRAGMSQATCRSCCRKRNAISSSYSSSRGVPALKRRAPAPSNSELPLGSSLFSGILPKKTQDEKVAEGRAGQPLPRKKGSASGDTGRPRKRKFPLLPRRRGEPLRLPPRLELAWPVTAEDLDREKKEALHRITGFLMGETQIIWDNCTMAPQAHACAPSALGGARPLASGGLSQTLPHHPGTATVGATTPMWVGSSFSTHGHPPTSNLSVPFSPSLPLAAWALPPRPSPSTLAGMVPQPVAPFGAINTIMSSQPLHLGPPSSLGRSFLPSHQGPKHSTTHRASPIDGTSHQARRARRHTPYGKLHLIPGATIPPMPGVPTALNFARTQYGHLGAPGLVAAPIPPWTAGPPALGSPNFSAFGTHKHTKPTMVSHASTQAHSAGSQAARPAGALSALTSASVAAPQRPGPVASVCPKNRQDNQVAPTSRLPERVTSRASEKIDLSPGLATPRKVITISKSRGSPTTGEHNQASLGQNISSSPGQSTTTAPKEHKNKGKRGQGNNGLPTLSATPQHLPFQEPQSLAQGTNTNSRKATSGGLSVPITSMGSGSPDLLPDLISAFGAMHISSEGGGTPSPRQQPNASLGQSTTMGTKGQKVACKPGQATTGVLTLSAIPQSLPKQNTLSSPEGTSTTSRKSSSTERSVPIPAKGPGSPDLVPGLTSPRTAMSISSKSRGNPRSGEHNQASLEQNTRSAPGQSTTTAPPKNKNKSKRGQGNNGIPSLSATPQHLPTQGHHSSGQATKTNSRKATCASSSVDVTSLRSESPDLLPDLLSDFWAMCTKEIHMGS